MQAHCSALLRLALCQKPVLGELLRADGEAVGRKADDGILGARHRRSNKKGLPFLPT